MVKVIRRYKILLIIIIFSLAVTTMVNVTSKIRLDKVTLIKNKVYNYKDEFKNAKENNFIKFKGHLLEKDIILDNIQYNSNGTIYFDINKNMYLNEIIDFIKFLGDTPNLRINRMDIIKDNLDYTLSISAEI